MEINCQNCEETITANFCNKCGQKKYNRIDKKYILDELQYTLIHTNKGFLYSVKKTLLNPGKTAREFIYGNRVNHYKPIGLAFVLSTISAFISYKIIGFGDIMKKNVALQKTNVALQTELMDGYMSVIQNYSAFMMLLCIPFLAFFSRLAFRKSGQNYYEHTVMNAYGLSFYTIISILVMFPIIFLLRNHPETINSISVYSMLLMPIMMVWFYKNFYPEKTITNIILRVTFINFLFGIIFFAIIFVAMVSYIVYLGPEALKFLPKK